MQSGDISRINQNIERFNTHIENYFGAVQGLEVVDGLNGGKILQEMPKTSSKVKLFVYDFFKRCAVFFHLKKYPGWNPSKDILDLLADDLRRLEYYTAAPKQKASADASVKVSAIIPVDIQDNGPLLSGRDDLDSLDDLDNLDDESGPDAYYYSGLEDDYSEDELVDRGTGALQEKSMKEKVAYDHVLVIEDNSALLAQLDRTKKVLSQLKPTVAKYSFRYFIRKFFRNEIFNNSRVASKINPLKQQLQDKIDQVMKQQGAIDAFNKNVMTEIEEIVELVGKLSIPRIDIAFGRVKNYINENLRSRLLLTLNVLSQLPTFIARHFPGKGCEIPGRGCEKRTAEFLRDFVCSNVREIPENRVIFDKLIDVLEKTNIDSKTRKEFCELSDFISRWLVGGTQKEEDESQINGVRNLPNSYAMQQLYAKEYMTEQNHSILIQRYIHTFSRKETCSLQELYYFIVEINNNYIGLSPHVNQRADGDMKEFDQYIMKTMYELSQKVTGWVSQYSAHSDQDVIYRARLQNLMDTGAIKIPGFPTDLQVDMDCADDEDMARALAAQWGS